MINTITRGQWMVALERTTDILVLVNLMYVILTIIARLLFVGSMKTPTQRTSSASASCSPPSASN
jgi:hypothetical protein